MTRPLAASFLLALALLLAGCAPEPEKYRFGGSTMGTFYSATLVNVDAATGARLDEAVADELEEINRIFSTYIDDSELNLLNRQPLGEPFHCTKELYDVLEMSLEVYRRSNGAFDPTVRPLVGLWGFGPDGRWDHVPDEAEIQARLEIVGLDGLVLDPEARAAIRTRELTLDLSGVAKGYGVDVLARLIERFGVTNYMVDIGGDLRVSGVNPHGTKWRIAVESASEMPGDLATIMALSDRGVATSGDYRNYFEADGQRFSHTIDPATGYPIDHNLASVTVIASDAALADAWATAFMVAGAEQALAIADREDIPVYLLVKQPDGFEPRHNAAFAPYLQPISREAE